MKKKLSLNKKMVKNLKLKLRKPSDRKVAPLLADELMEPYPTNGMSC